MSIEQVVDIVYSKDFENWKKNNKKALESLFGAQQGRYHVDAGKTVQLRAPDINFKTGVPFAAYINPNNPESGPYGGFSFVIFPAENKPALIGLVVGTQGLAPDEAVLGRPGHARKSQAICGWLNAKFGSGKQVAWAKQDPSRTDISMPDLPEDWADFKPVFKRYGQVIYAIFKPTEENKAATREAAAAFLDLMFDERGYGPNAANAKDARNIRDEWHEHLMPDLTRADVKNLLDQKRFLVIQGPPGTGKTRMAQEILEAEFNGCGKIIQLHPNSTYETFIGGLAPVRSEQGIGLQFAPKAGFLMDAAKAALASTTPFLLVVDEINRADLSKILGEAIFLLEPHPTKKREIELPYDFGPPFHTKLAIPENLFILGTMNTADRSIAIVDVAIRRRFAFVSLWPQSSVVKTNGCGLMQDHFEKVVDIFIEHAQEDAFNLIPGHSYFLEKDQQKAKLSLQTGLAPLLEEYLAQGYIGGFSEQVRAYLQELRSLKEK
ncbi:MAG TPA: AAA family ATPase [Candidatus Angelobacter sp.]|nr:AAA family ATPase [Candidatus Angelobacter sp.]